MGTFRRLGLCSHIDCPHYGDPEKAFVVQPYSSFPTVATPRRQVLYIDVSPLRCPRGGRECVAIFISLHCVDLDNGDCFFWGWG